MKYINLLFIISLMISFSLQEKVLEQTQEQTEELLNAQEELLSIAELQLGSQEESQVVEENTLTEEFAENYFNGNWLMYGYGCNARTPKVEKGHCKMQGTTVICTKTLGDDCVTTGTETFRGVLPAQLKTGENIPITYVVGNARKPNSGHWKNSMHIVNLNEFRSQNRIYKRDPEITSLTPKPAPAPVLPKLIATVTELPKLIAPAPVLPKLIAPAPAQRLVYYYTNYFLGNWNGIGYVCDKQTPQIEVVNIRYKKGRLYAVKILGDNCVPAGKLSFEGATPAKIWQGENIPVKFVIGSPEHPAAKEVDNHITIIDLNTFKIGTHIFYRVMGEGHAHPHGVYIDMTSLNGHSNYPGPGFIKMNPRKNMRSPVRRFVIVEEETNKPGNC